jgi:hypothetical protein
LRNLRRSELLFAVTETEAKLVAGIVDIQSRDIELYVPAHLSLPARFSDLPLPTHTAVHFERGITGMSGRVPELLLERVTDGAV